MGPHSQIVQPAQYQVAIPFDIYQKGNEHLNAENKNAIANVDAQVAELANIPVVSESDHQILQNKMQEVKQNLSKIALGNIGSPQGQQQIRGYLSQVANDPDIQAVAARGYSYRNALQEKKQAEKDGKVYFNYALDQAQDYQKQGVYVRDTRFNNQGGVAPDEAKMMEDVKKIVTPRKVRVDLGNGQYEIQEQYDPQDLAAGFKTLQDANPMYKTYQQYKFNSATKDTDWNDYANQHFAPIVNTSQNNYLLASANYENAIRARNPVLAAHYQGVMNDSEKDINTYTSIMNSPHAALEIKNKAFENQLKDDLASKVHTMDAIQQSDIKMTEHQKLSEELGNSLYKTRQEEVFKSLLPGLGSLPQDQQTKFLKGDFSGIDISKMQQAANDAMLAKEVNKITQTTTAREEVKFAIKQKRGIALGDGKVPGDTLITVGEGNDVMTKTKDEWIKSIDRMKLGKSVADDKNVALYIVKDSPEKFGLTPLQAGAMTAEQLVIKNGKLEFNPAWYKSNSPVAFDSQLETALYGNLGGSKPSSTTPKTTQSINRGKIDLGGGKTVEAQVVSSVADTSKLSKGEYYILNGKPYIKD